MISWIGTVNGCVFFYLATYLKAGHGAQCMLTKTTAQMVVIMIASNITCRAPLKELTSQYPVPLLMNRQ